MPSYMQTNEYGLYSAFDIEKHNQTFIDYFEAVLMADGTVQYAVPSHQEKLIEIGKEKYGKSRDDFIAMCPREMYYDYMEWLCEVTGCVAMLSRFVVGKPNSFQLDKIHELIDARIVSPCVLNILNEGGSYAECEIEQV